MELSYLPVAPWHWLATAAAAIIGVLVILAWLLPARRVALGRKRATQTGAGVLLCIAAAALAVAAWNPVLVKQRDPERLHLVVVLDSSPSVLRARGGWPAVREATARLISNSLKTLSDQVRATGTANIITFRDTAAEVLPAPRSLVDLPDRVRNVKPDELAGDGSNLAAGLLLASKRLETSKGSGAVLLVSDGLQTSGDASAAATLLAQRGIPVFVYTVQSEAAEIAISAANLPRQSLAGDETTLRSTIWNGRTASATAALSITLNTGLSDATPRVSAAVSSEKPIQQTLAHNDSFFLRAPVVFGGHGMQFVDLTLAYDGGRGMQRRRFYTYVKRPLELLSIGGDRRWQAAFPQAAARIKEIAPKQLSSAGDLRAYDAIVISAVAANDFAPGELAAIAQAVERDGVGLMLFNGDHGGAPKEAATVIKSYTGTPIDPLLPVESGPRPFEEQPPSRHVIFLIDASGSMGGWKLDKAKEIATSIIENQMRPTDKVDIIAFNTSAMHLVKNQETIASAKPGIVSQLDSIQVGGGTDPTEALNLIANQQFTECGLIFLTDGEFSAVNLRPDCRATAFSIGGGFSPALSQFADPFAVDQNFDPAGVTMPYFKPEKRTRLWEPGEFAPLSTAVISRTTVRLPVPSAVLPGSAITHTRPGAELVAVRPKLIDPVLAYNEHGIGYVGVMTSAVPSDWLQHADTLAAVEEWVRQVVPYAAGDRYDIDLHDNGSHMALRIALVSKDNHVPLVSGMQISLEQPGRPAQPVAVNSVPESPATFVADLNPERGSTASEATLVIRESGRDSLVRPQRLPLVVPPSGSLAAAVTSEAYSFGSDEKLLNELTEAGGGQLLVSDATPKLFTLSPPSQDSRPLWPWLLPLAGLLYLLAIAVRRTGL